MIIYIIIFIAIAILYNTILYCFFIDNEKPHIIYYVISSIIPLTYFIFMEINSYYSVGSGMILLVFLLECDLLVFSLNLKANNLKKIIYATLLYLAIETITIIMISYGLMSILILMGLSMTISIIIIIANIKNLNKNKKNGNLSINKKLYSMNIVLGIVGIVLLIFCLLDEYAGIDPIDYPMSKKLERVFSGYRLVEVYIKAIAIIAISIVYCKVFNYYNKIEEKNEKNFTKNIK